MLLLIPCAMATMIFLFLTSNEFSFLSPCFATTKNKVERQSFYGVLGFDLSEKKTLHMAKCMFPSRHLQICQTY